MPFTISHTVAVIPLFRWQRLDPLALVIGSMAPDFGYFAHRFAFAGEAHTRVGCLTHALPTAAVLWLLCRVLGHFLIRPLPPRWRVAAAHLMDHSAWRVSALWWVPLSLLLGVWSHVVWDSFTHKSGWMVTRISLLEWPVYHVLQHASSILGLVVLAWAYLRSIKSDAAAEVRDRNATVLMGLAVVAVLCAMPFAWNYAGRHEGYLQLRAFTFRSVVNAMAFWVCGYLAYASLLQAQVWRWQARAIRASERSFPGK